MVKGQGKGKGPVSSAPPPVLLPAASSASLLSSLLSRPLPATKAVQMAAFAGLGGWGGGGGWGGVLGGVGGGQRPPLTLAPASNAKDLFKNTNSNRHAGGGLNLGGGGGGGGGGGQRAVIATLGDLEHVVVIHEDPDELVEAAGEEGREGGGEAAVVEEGEGVPQGGLTSGVDRLSALKALAQIDVLAALSMFSMPNSK